VKDLLKVPVTKLWQCFLMNFKKMFTVHMIYLDRPLKTIKTVFSDYEFKNDAKFGNGDGKWSKMKDLLLNKTRHLNSIRPAITQI
jgi:hypothetical protein